MQWACLPARLYRMSDNLFYIFKIQDRCAHDATRFLYNFMIFRKSQKIMKFIRNRHFLTTFETSFWPNCRLYTGKRLKTGPKTGQKRVISWPQTWKMPENGHFRGFRREMGQNGQKRSKRSKRVKQWFVGLNAHMNLPFWPKWPVLTVLTLTAIRGHPGTPPHGSLVPCMTRHGLYVEMALTCQNCKNCQFLSKSVKMCQEKCDKTRRVTSKYAKYIYKINKFNSKTNARSPSGMTRISVNKIKFNIKDTECLSRVSWQETVDFTVLLFLLFCQKWKSRNRTRLPVSFLSKQCFTNFTVFRVMYGSAVCL